MTKPKVRYLGAKTISLMPTPKVEDAFFARVKKLPKTERDALSFGYLMFSEMASFLAVRLEIWEQNKRNRKAGRV